jgi:hypothetical protein
LPSGERSRRDAQLPHDDELQEARDGCARQRDATPPHVRAWLTDDEAVSPVLELLKPARVLCSLSGVELHARTVVHHGHDANYAQPDVLHAVTWNDLWQMLFYSSDCGHSGPRSFSFSRTLYRKKPDKLR